MSEAILESQNNPNYLSNIKRFGVMLAIITFLFGILLPYKIILAVAAILAAITTLYPQSLYPIYRVLTPPLSMGLKVLLAVLFYTVVTPLAYLIRILEIDIIQRNIQPEVKSYWVKRTTLIPHGKYMQNQR